MNTKDIKIDSPFPLEMTVSVSERYARDFCLDGFEFLWDYLMLHAPNLVAEFINVHLDELKSYMTAVEDY